MEREWDIVHYASGIPEVTRVPGYDVQSALYEAQNCGVPLFSIFRVELVSQVQKEP